MDDKSPVAECEGCMVDAPGQLAHMGPNGCLETADSKIWRQCLEEWATTGQDGDAASDAHQRIEKKT